MTENEDPGVPATSPPGRAGGVAASPSEVPPVIAPALRDRSGFLAFLGVVEIVLGALLAFFGLAVLHVIADGAAGAATRTGAAALWMNVAFYLGGAIVLVTVGIGTIRVRRWARVLMLLVSWSLLISAVVGIAGLMVILPGMVERMPPAAGDDPAVTRLVLYLVMAITGLFLVGLPGFFIAAYSGRHVRHTFATRHAERSWVDGRPPAVLGLGLVMALFGVAHLAGSWTGIGVLFGIPLHGAVAILVNILIAGAWIGLGWGLCRLSRAAWLSSFVFVVLIHLSAALAFRNMSLLEAGYRLGWGAGEAGLLGGVAPLIERYSVWGAALVGTAWIVSLVAVGRHFRGDRAAP